MSVIRFDRCGLFTTWKLLGKLLVVSQQTFRTDILKYPGIK